MAYIVKLFRLICLLGYFLNIIAYTDSLYGLLNPEVQCRIQKNSPVIAVLSRINQFLVLAPIFLISILIFSSHLCLGLPKGLFHVGNCLYYLI